jgi:hypothetical protein
MKSADHRGPALDRHLRCRRTRTLRRLPPSRTRTKQAAGAKKLADAAKSVDDVALALSGIAPESDMAAAGASDTLAPV